MAGVIQFQINVPNKTTVGQLPIMRVKAIISIESDMPVTFRITAPASAGQQTTLALIPGSTPSPLIFTAAGRPAPFVITITPPLSTIPTNDPKRRRYLFQIELTGDYNANANCASVMSGAETWTIERTAGPNITSTCLTSFDRNIMGQQCIGNVRVVPFTEPVATVVSFPGPTLGCAEFRPGLDAVLVLDKSGSMAGSTLGSTPQFKIDALHNAVTDFVTVWDGLRTTEGANAPLDKIGVVTFDSTASWWSSLPANLNAFSTALKTTIESNVNNITPGTATSIGSGLLLADGQLNMADPTRRRVILLMSNGMQNRTPMVGVFSNQLVTYPSSNPNNRTPVPSQSNYQVYAVTVGTSTAVSPQINQDIATVTRGFYINTETDAALMTPFFLELLQNFIKFNSWETYRLVRATLNGTTPRYSTTLPVSTTTQYLSFMVRWPEHTGVLRLRVTPPGEPNPFEQVASSVIQANFAVPTSDAYDFKGEWKIEVEAADVGRQQLEAGIPFDLIVLGEDAAVDSEMLIVQQDYVPGMPIKLEAHVTEFDKAVTNLGAQPGDQMIARIVKPGTGVGDLLSTSKASTTQPFASDTSTNADAKLYNELQNNPGALLRNDQDVITLVHSGNGVYTGSYMPQKPGHYDFVFGLEGTTDNTGRFSRQQIKTVYVRPAPDPTPSNYTTVVRPAQRGSQLVITMTPRTRFGDRLGPGWANYFWFTAPNHQPFKSQDNLDGTYTAQLPFNGLLTPRVSSHFLNVSMVIGDDVTSDNLPVPLDNSTVLIDNVVKGGCLQTIIYLLKRLLGL